MLRHVENASYMVGMCSKQTCLDQNSGFFYFYFLIVDNKLFYIVYEIISTGICWGYIPAPLLKLWILGHF